MTMAASVSPDPLTELLDNPSFAPLRKFGSLGYSLLLRLQSDITAIEAHGGTALRACIDLDRTTTTAVALSPEVSTEDRRLEEELRCKLIKYYMLLDIFSKVQSSRTPHKVVLKQFDIFLERNLQTEIKQTPWFDHNDLMNPFTNHLPQGNLITMNLVILFNKMRLSDWFGAIIGILPYCIRRCLEHPGYPEDYTLSTDDISNWFSKLVIIVVPTIIVAPMFALYAIPSTWVRMAALWGFAIIFAIMTRQLASPSSDLIFATNAAFCAVLVVFVGNSVA